jgi:hypothetical protein
MRHKLTILQDFHGTVQDQLNGVKIPKGTVLYSDNIVNNGTPFLAYECILNGHKVFVKPLIGYVQTEEA